EGIGDTSWVAAGAFVGTRGQSRRMEGIAFELSGPKATDYVVVYQAHLQGYGDTGEFTNGEFCGTRGESRRLEAFIVRIMPKSQYHRNPVRDLRSSWGAALGRTIESVTPNGMSWLG